MTRAAFDTGLRPEDLDLERPAPVETPWGCFALFPRDGGLVAVECWCPHMQGPLLQGTHRKDAAGEDELTCPWHGWRFSLLDGRCTWAPSPADRASRVRLLRAEVGPAGTVLVHPPAL